MPRKLLMVLLAVGAVCGFGAGFARLVHGHGPFGHGREGRHAFERRIADVCAESALRVSGQGNGARRAP